MFTTGRTERGQSEISIMGVDGAILQQLVDYCYSGEIVIDSTNAEGVARVAEMLQFTAAQEHCTEFYLDSLNATNCLGILEVADEYNMVRLKETAHDFIMQHFMEVSKCDEFLRLTVDQLVVLLKNDEINVQNEEDVFHTLMDWVKCDVKGRKRSLVRLLECVRFQHIKDSVSIPFHFILSIL